MGEPQSEWGKELKSAVAALQDAVVAAQRDTTQAIAALREEFSRQREENAKHSESIARLWPITLALLAAIFLGTGYIALFQRADLATNTANVANLHERIVELKSEVDRMKKLPQLVEGMASAVAKQGEDIGAIKGQIAAVSSKISGIGDHVGGLVVNHLDAEIERIQKLEEEALKQLRAPTVVAFLSKKNVADKGTPEDRTFRFNVPVRLGLPQPISYVVAVGLSLPPGFSLKGAVSVEGKVTGENQITVSVALSDAADVARVQSMLDGDEAMIASIVVGVALNSK